MRFDLSGCGAGLDESAKGLVELGPFAERLGYDGLWINEEHFGQGSRVCFSPIPVATARAMRTRTIRIGFSVLVLPLFEPIRLAEEIAKTRRAVRGTRRSWRLARQYEPIL